MGDTRSTQGAASTVSLVLAIVAFAGIGGFVYWLSITAKGEESAVDLIEPEPDVRIITMADLIRGSEDLVGQEVQVQYIRVSEKLGDHLVWIGPENSQFLVKKDSVVRAQAAEIQVGSRILVVGTMWAMSDSVEEAWEEIDVYGGEGDRTLISFESVFLEARRLEVY